MGLGGRDISELEQSAGPELVALVRELDRVVRLSIDQELGFGQV